MPSPRSGPPLNPQDPSFWEFLELQAESSGPSRAAVRHARLRRMAAQPSAVRAFPARHALASQYVERVGRDDAAAGGSRESRAWRLLHMMMLDLAPHRLRRDLRQWLAWWERPAAFRGPLDQRGAPDRSWRDVLRQIRCSDSTRLTHWLEELVAPRRTPAGVFPPWEPYVSGVRRHGVFGSRWWPEASSGRADTFRWRRPAPAGSTSAQEQTAFQFAPILVLGFAEHWSSDLLSLCADIVGLESFAGMVRARLKPEDISLDERWTAQDAPAGFWRAILTQRAEEFPGRWVGGDGTWQHLGERDVWQQMARQWVEGQLAELQHPTARSSASLDLRLIGTWLLERSACWSGRRAIGPDLWLILLQAARHVPGRRTPLEQASTRASQDRDIGFLAVLPGDMPGEAALQDDTLLDWLIAHAVSLLETHGVAQMRETSLVGGDWRRLMNDVSIQGCLRDDSTLARKLLRGIDLRSGLSESLVLTLLQFGQPGHWTRQQWQLVRRMCLSLLAGGEHSLVSVDPGHFHDVAPFFGAACSAIASLPAGDEVRSLLFRVVLQQVLHLNDGGSRGRLLGREAQLIGQTAVLEQLWGAWMAGEPAEASEGASPLPLTICVPRLAPIGAGRYSFQYLVERPWSPTLARFLLVAPLEWLCAWPRATWKQGLLSPDADVRQRWLGRLAALVETPAADDEESSEIPGGDDGAGPQGSSQESGARLAHDPVCGSAGRG